MEQYVYVIYDPMNDGFIICVHEESNMICGECKEIRDILKRSNSPELEEQMCLVAKKKSDEI